MISTRVVVLAFAGASLLAAASFQDDSERAAALAAKIGALQLELAELRGGPGADLEAEESVNPGINDSWKSDNIRPLIQRLEAESREIFVHCDTIAALAGPVAGSVVADIGAGSGFLAQVFAELVGEDGKVYAVDINRTLMQRLSKAAEVAGLEQLETVVCTEKSAELPPESVDLAFVCDTYHHFEYPRNTLRSLYSALRPGGQLLIIDFHRVPGVSREWILEHVRAGQETVREEILGAGFELVNEHYLPQLEENYAMRFRKPG